MVVYTPDGMESSKTVYEYNPDNSIKAVNSYIESVLRMQQLYDHEADTITFIHYDKDGNLTEKEIEYRDKIGMLLYTETYDANNNLTRTTQK